MRLFPQLLPDSLLANCVELSLSDISVDYEEYLDDEVLSRFMFLIVPLHYARKISLDTVDLCYLYVDSGIFYVSSLELPYHNKMISNTWFKKHLSDPKSSVDSNIDDIMISIPKSYFDYHNIPTQINFQYQRELNNRFDRHTWGKI